MSKADEKNNSNNINNYNYINSNEDASIALLESDDDEASSLGTSYDYEDDDDDDDDDDNDDDTNGNRSGRGRRKPGSRGGGGGDEKDCDIARTETRAMRWLKCIVLSTFFLSMIAVALAVYFYTTDAQEVQFRADFNVHAVQVVDAIQDRLWQSLDAIDSFVVGLVTFANYTNQTWPFVTLPGNDFVLRASKMQSLAQATRIRTFPYVTSSQRDEWQNYTTTHSYEWIRASLTLEQQQLQLQAHGKSINDNTTSPELIMAIKQDDSNNNNNNWDVIFNNAEFEKEHPGVTGTDSPGPYLPMWQVFPVVPGRPIYNWDLYSSSDKSLIDAIMVSHRPSLSQAKFRSEYPPLPIVYDEQVMAMLLDEPTSDFLYPIIPKMVMNGNINSNQDMLLNAKVKGILSMSFYWRDHLQDLLPPTFDGLILVFENQCNASTTTATGDVNSTSPLPSSSISTFTYQINGPSAQFLGVGDHHETQFDDMELSTWLFSDTHDTETSDGAGAAYSGIPVNEDSCPFLVRVYPSQVMENRYTTSSPITLTMAAVLVFVLTSALFLIYDCWVERRQREILRKAVHSIAIVSSLFPSVVRDRIFPFASSPAAAGSSRTLGGKNGENGAILAAEDTPKKRLNNIVHRRSSVGASTGSSQQQEGGVVSDYSKPVAELFPDSTVLFADLAGFTAWSSVREPSQVFVLLETIYGAFDAIARKRNVFKVETIGDCYVAVTGCPEPQKHHAPIMVKFAADCRAKMNLLTIQLETTLGPGTADLKLRQGLHSGSVTAGVLRNDKSRFQLFGDTVNTAARMESNGERDFIHCSQRTAELLIRAGKKHWITARDDKIVAKGKGKMQTYWVEPTLKKGRVFPKSEVCDASMTEVTSFSDMDRSSYYLDKSSYFYTQPLPSNSADKKMERLIDWNVALFEELLMNVVSHRYHADTSARRNSMSSTRRGSASSAFRRDSTSSMAPEQPRRNSLSSARRGSASSAPRRDSTSSITAGFSRRNSTSSAPRRGSTSSMSAGYSRRNSTSSAPRRDSTSSITTDYYNRRNSTSSAPRRESTSSLTADYNKRNIMTCPSTSLRRDSASSMATDYNKRNSISSNRRGSASSGLRRNSASSNGAFRRDSTSSIMTDYNNRRNSLNYTSDRRDSMTSVSSFPVPHRIWGGPDWRDFMKVTPLSTAEIEEMLGHSPGDPVDFRDEMSEIIALPDFNGRAVAARRGSVGDGYRDDDTLQLGAEALDQLRSFITAIGRSYRKNAFHNFEHGSHVVMSVSKLLARISTPDMQTMNPTEQDVHDFGYGISSDPIVHLALAMAALVHDCDHEGVPNGQLITEEAPAAVRYKNKSVAEQNSLDVAWNMLMRPEYEDLRLCIFSNEVELKQFRQLLVNAVLSTDIFDKELIEFRESRWTAAFKSSETKALPRDDSDKSLEDKSAKDRRATIIIENIMQASDVSHCMQHWTVYQMWNEKLFREMYSAYKMGRSDKDPSDFWYDGELWFFDTYIIPLAKKLKECGVFGPSYSEFLNFAVDNRIEWEGRGKDIVEEMVNAYNQEQMSTSFNQLREEGMHSFNELLEVEEEAEQDVKTEEETGSETSEEMVNV